VRRAPWRPPRSSSGYRAFGAESVGQIRFIKHAQALGFSLKEVKELLSLRTDPHSTGGDVRKRAKAKIIDIEEKIKALKDIKDELVQLVAACDGTSSISDCPILKSLGSERT